MASVSEGTAGAKVATVKLWDLPMRLFHWAIVLLMGGLWWSAEQGDLTLHKQLGMIMLILLVFRFLWGLVGSSTARFAGFLRSPSAVLAYGRGLFGKAGDPIVGHNPLGGWSAMLLLVLLAVQVSLGLISQDTDGIESGPLNHLVEYDTAEWAREAHELIVNVLLGLTALHVVAIVFYLVVRRDNLITPMLTGKRSFGLAVIAPRLAPWWLALLCLFVAWAIGGWVWSGAPL
jgi:cytochrome b